jgi:hypothetical protein
LGVSGDETIPSRVSAALRAQEPNKKFRVYNAGVASYGPRQEAILLRRISDRVKPAVVVVLFYDGNDLDDCRVQYVTARDNGLEHGLLPSERSRGEGAASRPSSYSWVRAPSLLEREFWVRRSAFYRLLDDRIGPILVRAGLLDPLLAFNDTMLRAMKKAPDIDTNDELDLAKGALEDLALRCREIGAQLVVARLPAKIQAEPFYFDALLADLGLSAAAYDRTLPGAAILGFLSEKGIPSLDLLPSLEHRERRSNPNYFQEGHPNRTGNQTIADALSGEIRKRM